MDDKRRQVTVWISIAFCVAIVCAVLMPDRRWAGAKAIPVGAGIEDWIPTDQPRGAKPPSRHAVPEPGGALELAGSDAPPLAGAAFPPVDPLPPCTRSVEAYLGSDCRRDMESWWTRNWRRAFASELSLRLEHLAEIQGQGVTPTAAQILALIEADQESWKALADIDRAIGDVTSYVLSVRSYQDDPFASELEAGGLEVWAMWAIFTMPDELLAEAVALSSALSRGGDVAAAERTFLLEGWEQMRRAVAALEEHASRAGGDALEIVQEIETLSEYDRIVFDPPSGSLGWFATAASHWDDGEPLPSWSSN